MGTPLSGTPVIFTHLLPKLVQKQSPELAEAIASVGHGRVLSMYPEPETKSVKVVFCIDGNDRKFAITVAPQVFSTLMVAGDINGVQSMKLEVAVADPAAVIPTDAPAEPTHTQHQIEVAQWAVTHFGQQRIAYASFAASHQSVKLARSSGYGDPHTNLNAFDTTEDSSSTIQFSVGESATYNAALQLLQRYLTTPSPEHDAAGEMIS